MLKSLIDFLKYFFIQILGETLCCSEGKSNNVLQRPKNIQKQTRGDLQERVPSRPHRGSCRRGRRLYQEEARVQIEVSPAECSDERFSKYFVSLRLLNGGDYLFQALDDEQMNLWVDAINRQAQGLEEAPGKSQTLPPGSEKKDEPKRRSFFTLKKK